MIYGKWVGEALERLSKGNNSKLTNLFSLYYFLSYKQFVKVQQFVEEICAAAFEK